MSMNEDALNKKAVITVSQALQESLVVDGA